MAKHIKSWQGVSPEKVEGRGFAGFKHTLAEKKQSKRLPFNPLGGIRATSLSRLPLPTPPPKTNSRPKALFSKQVGI